MRIFELIIAAVHIFCGAHFMYGYWKKDNDHHCIMAMLCFILALVILK